MIAITGANGRLGHALALALHSRGLAEGIRLTTRDPAQAQAALHKHLKGFEMFLQATNQMGQISTEGGEGVTETGVKP